MAKKARAEEEPILPTEIEAHFGKVTDPRGHEAEIENAIEVLHRFCNDLSAVTLREVQSAASVLGNYSGYPKEAHEFESYLDSEFAQASYRTVAEHLPYFVANMLNRIEARKHMLSVQEQPSPGRSSSDVGEDDLPF
jgi:hypothetical protein